MSLGPRIKIGERCSSPSPAPQLLIEARLHLLLKHPNLLQLIGVCTEKMPYYIVLELMTGGNLRHYVLQCRPTSQPRLATLERSDFL